VTSSVEQVPPTRARRRGVPRSLRRNRVGRWALARRRHLLTRRELRRDPQRFQEVGTCCLFIGHVKSGGSLLGAMLDAHPATAVADEVDVAAQVAAGLDREQIFTLLVRGARREASGGRVTARRLDAYSLAIPGQWQGRHDRLELVGDSRAGPTTRALGESPEQLARLWEVMGDTRVAFVHVVRNPYEPISAMVRRSGRPLSDAIADHRAQCRRLVVLRRHLASGDLHTVRYEDLVADPERQVRDLSRFLDLEASPSFVTACIGLLHEQPVRERDRIAWRPDDIAAVAETIARYDFLAGYRYDR
jgi:hypothetical protein